MNLFLQRAIEIARLAGNQVATNPRVGAVIVYNNQIIGEGYHAKWGEPHAEVQAINAVQDKSLLRKSILYVTLEPCNHYGKTPPCTELIIRSQIPKVIIGSKDPYPQVAGKGIERLQQAGICVELVTDPTPFYELNKFFFTNQLFHRPYVTLKWAETANGFIGNTQMRMNISGKETLCLTHFLRAEHQGIVVGKNTVLVDDPQLTVRFYPGFSPIRLLLDPQLEITTGAKVLEKNAEVWHLNQIKEGVENHIRYIQVPFTSPWPIKELLEYLYTYYSLSSVLVEGGAFTLQRFIEASVFDEIFVFRSSLIFPEANIRAPQLPESLSLAYKGAWNKDLIYHYRRPGLINF
ncbi:MAG: bifunctional diaminohydroxyphosphoribosylaminopyrimidine deaminase/5-amino-6-(5-phosphoribosylamino)uracil reductase RibD [Bacteroidia bacterium]|nr:bifunctional diaminohydroxyphosphoribosylaminopyrimidine deaminase/5-amino-6-(5-phosphoribosylamino)uracil reductase RibD [Bacteroidia bacterium]MDW8157800.1 bifunctional diaminohydroxyphosphoribosylaminopyrimidine deaminase/5-amino-6-(5-phosphoribosylamino)uracil reductase RibD [Bacteroidia bacterium]